MNDLIIAGVIVAAIVGGGLLLFGLPELTGGFGVLTRADIGQVMTIWSYEFADAEEGCLNISGTWYDDDDWWGCVDANFPDATHCVNEIAYVIEEMCEGMNAVWTCDRDNAYCKYE